jgi:hypothetical protein
MKTFLLIAGALSVALIGAIILLARSHKRWLERQTPAGLWQAADGQARITLLFEGGPREGVYKQLIESDGKRIREFGHWSASGHDLKMIIMATDIKSHPRFGQDTPYGISYIGPTRIKIEGPERSAITYERAPAGLQLEFVREVEPGASPKGGPGAPSDHSGASEGPPSVSA